MNAQTQQAGTDYDWTAFSNITQPTNPGAALKAEQPMRRQHWINCVLCLDPAVSQMDGGISCLELLPPTQNTRSLLANTLLEKTNNLRVLLELLEF